VKPALIVIAKAPTAGRVKTRIAVDIGDQQAADLAAAALLDTMDTADRWAAPSRRLAYLAGAVRGSARGDEIADRLRAWQVAVQPDLPFAARIVGGFLAAARLWGDRPCVIVGMDTPQVTPGGLDALLEGCSGRTRGQPTACVGPADDGGWWGLAISRPSAARVLESVPMSTPETFQWTVDALRSAGVAVRHGGSLRDMDTMADALAIARAFPQLRTAQALRPVVSSGAG
jgi:glycosyltransferase A (GT-A) superfamily protein (DUF2064 family)